jgi:hypothetical protein
METDTEPMENVGVAIRDACRARLTIALAEASPALYDDVQQALALCEHRLTLGDLKALDKLSLRLLWRVLTEAVA